MHAMVTLAVIIALLMWWSLPKFIRDFLIVCVVLFVAGSMIGGA
jgi:hypothetical protein